MSAWRRLAIELFPEKRRLFQKEDSIMQILFDLLPMAVTAHQENNLAELQRIYQFTEWCHAQKRRAFQVWEAAHCAFYEHLIDEEVTLEAIPYWVKPKIFQDMLEEYQLRLESIPFYVDQNGPGKFQALLSKYNSRHGTTFARKS